MSPFRTPVPVCYWSLLTQPHPTTRLLVELEASASFLTVLYPPNFKFQNVSSYLSTPGSLYHHLLLYHLFVQISATASPLDCLLLTSKSFWSLLYNTRS